eukprot:scaffold239830_cov35-Tisochrysis_lutea.AAC.2
MAHMCDGLYVSLKHEYKRGKLTGGTFDLLDGSRKANNFYSRQMRSSSLFLIRGRVRTLWEEACASRFPDKQASKGPIKGSVAGAGAGMTERRSRGRITTVYLLADTCVSACSWSGAGAGMIESKGRGRGRITTLCLLVCQGQGQEASRGGQCALQLLQVQPQNLCAQQWQRAGAESAAAAAAADTVSHYFVTARTCSHPHVSSPPAFHNRTRSCSKHAFKVQKSEHGQHVNQHTLSAALPRVAALGGLQLINNYWGNNIECLKIT